MSLLVKRDCPIHDGCSEWIFNYLNDCVCSARDGFSLALGIISVFSWGIAEVPQIITNYKEKTTEGVSLLFLMTWVVGDFFNLAGCVLEPATLPTQFYMALLYTVTTLVLVAQTIYYTRIKKRARSPTEEPLLPEKPSRPPQKQPVEVQLPSQPVPSISVPSPSPRRQFYYTSARSLASSLTPTAGSYLSSSGKRGDYLASHRSLPGDYLPPETANSIRHMKAEPVIVRAVATGLILFGGYSFNSQHLPGSSISTTGRRLLQESEGHSRLGEMLGWGMAAIYMGGRLPQIWLNITRGTVEGLNPMMFFFALSGNATYVGNILVRSTDWSKLKHNLPWLVDAAVCVLLDFFILAQFFYYRFFKKGNNNGKSGIESGEK